MLKTQVRTLAILIYKVFFSGWHPKTDFQAWIPFFAEIFRKTSTGYRL
jgi:hypothetical protein